MSPEEFKQLLVVRTLTRKPLFLYRIDGTISVNLVVTYNPESDFVEYIQLTETENSLAEAMRPERRMLGEEYKAAEKTLSMDLTNYSRIVFEYEPKNYTFRYHFDLAYLVSRVKYADFPEFTQQA